MGSGRPTFGDPVAIDTSNGLGGASGALFIGVGPSSKIELPLPGPLETGRASGIEQPATALVRPDVVLPIRLGGAPGVPGVGNGSVPFVLPANPSLVGVNLNFQAVLLDAGAPLGVSMTNAIEMWIG